MRSSDSHGGLRRYLDDLLEGEERHAFEREMQSSPTLRQAVELQRRIDAGLRSRFESPRIDLPAAGRQGSQTIGATPGEGVRGEQSIPSPRAERGNRQLARNLAAIAALIAIIGVAGYYFLLAPQRAPFDQPHEVYARLVSAGFEPAVVCDSNEQFIDWMVDNHDQRMLIPVETPGVDLIGWDYRRVLTARTSVLLTRVSAGGRAGERGAKPPAERQEVIVLVEDRAEARRLFAPQGSGLNVFRKTLGDVVLYEVTPLSEPRLLPHAREPG